MTVDAPDLERPSSTSKVAIRRREPVTLTAFLPVVLSLIVILLGETVRGAPLGDALLYKVFLVLAIVLPGTVLWRMLGVRSRSLLEDVALGSALGLSVEVTLMWLLNFVGLQRWAAAWAVIVVGLSLVVPRFRVAWTRPSPRTPRQVSWSIALAIGLATTWVWRSGFSLNLIKPVPDLPGQWFMSRSHLDSYFHQALASAVTRTPLLEPWVPDSPLWYSIMVHQHVADIHQWTGIDLTLIFARLLVLPLAALLLCLSVTTAARMARGWMGQALAPLFCVLTAVISPYEFTTTGFWGMFAFGINLANSPTLAFCWPLFMAALCLCFIVLTDTRLRAPVLLFLFLVMFTAQGSKATSLPTIICGLALAVVSGLINRSITRWRPLFALLAISATAFSASFWLIYGVSPHGMTIGNGSDTMGSSAVLSLIGSMANTKVWAISLAILCGAWLFSAAPVLITTIVRQFDSRLVICVGVCVAGFAAALIGVGGGGAQIYFILTIWPAAAVAGAVSVDYIYFHLLPKRLRRRTGLVFLLLTGMLATVVVRTVIGWKPQDQPTGWSAVWAVARPLLAVAGVFLVIAAAFVIPLFRRQQIAWRARLSAFMAVALILVQGGMTAGLFRWDSPVIPPFLLRPSDLVWKGGGISVPADGAAAARWVRDHSNVGDIVSTNMHCRSPITADGCDPRHFWLAALSERQVLLEGWSYTNQAMLIAPGTIYYGPYWDQEFFDMNDQAIRDPDASTLQWLKDQSVTWIVVDRSVFPEGAALSQQATLELTSGDFAVYRVN